MDELQNLIARLEIKAQNLVSQLDALDMENRKLRSRITELETSVQLHKQKNKELENKNSILKVSGSISRNEDKQESKKARNVIDGLIKEIDRCLILLDN